MQTLSTTLSTLSEEYFDESGASLGQAGAEADGKEYALITARILDTASQPIPNAQVRFELDATTPDPGARIVHTDSSPDLLNFVSWTDAQGYATCRVLSNNGLASPLTINARVGVDPGTIFGYVEPTAASKGASGSHGTTQAAALTVSQTGVTYTDTLFEGQVTVAAESVTFRGCTFDAGPTGGTHCVRVLANRGVRFENCTFTNSGGVAVTGFGYWMQDCVFTEIGGSCAFMQHNSATPLEHDLTVFNDCVMERFGKNTPAPAVLFSPGSGLRLVRCSVRGFHEDGADGIPGYQMRGALQVYTRRPNKSEQIVILGCWLYGGGDYCVDARAIDSGPTPANFFVISNRWSAPGETQDPAGALEPYLLDVNLLQSQGNLDHNGAPLTALNRRGGAGWYYPSEYLDATVSLKLAASSIAIAHIDRFMASDIAGPSLAERTARFIGQVPLANDTTARAQVFRHRQVSNGVTAGQAGSYFGIYVDRFVDEFPTAVVDRMRIEGDPAASAVTIEFEEIAGNAYVFEASTTYSIQVESDFAVAEETTIPVSYTGTATGGGVDYSAPASVTIPTGSRFATLEITIVDDELVEGGETIIATLGTPDAGGGAIGARATHVLTINDFNSAGGIRLPEVQFERDYISAPEGSSFVMKVLMSRPYGADVDIDYFVNTPRSRANEWVGEGAGQATIPAGQTEAVFAIQSVDDLDIENPGPGSIFQEYAYVTITGTSGGINIGPNHSCYCRVIDNDVEPISPTPIDPLGGLGGGPVPAAGASPQISFMTSESLVPEGAPVPLMLHLSVPSQAPISLPFTITHGSGAGPADYTLTDQNGATIASPITIPPGSSSYTITFTAVDDVVDESSEDVTLELGSPTGDSATIGGFTEHMVTIIDNDDPPATGADGELYGLVPDRQTLDYANPDIRVFPDRYEIVANPGLGIAASTVTTADPIRQAVLAAEPIWTAKNAVLVSVLQDVSSSRLVKGTVVMIQMNGDFASADIEGGSWGGDDNPNDTDFLRWRQGTTSGGYPIIRDVCLYGGTGPGTDILPHIGVQWSEFDEVTTGPYAAPGQYRIATNIIFSNLSIEGDADNQACVRSVTQSVDAANPPAQALMGQFRFYNVYFRTDRDTLATGDEYGVKWGVRTSHRICWDFRSCVFDLFFEHSIYVDSPPGEFFVINCRQSKRGGNGRTFIQVVNRSNESPGISGYGLAVAMRNEVFDTSSGGIQNGGSDFTFVGFDGDIYLVDNMSLGDAAPALSSTARGSITVWCDGNRAPAKGVYKLPINGYDYATDVVHLWNHTVAYDAQAGPVRSEAIKFSGCRKVDIRGFSISGVYGRAQMRMDELVGGGGSSMELINGIRARHPDHGLFWDLRVDGRDGDPLTMPVSQYPGWQQDNEKIRSARARGQYNANSEVHFVTNQELDTGGPNGEPWDGDIVWPLSGRKPDARFEFLEDGMPVGASRTILAGELRRSCSRRAQVWQYRRLLENYTTGDFTEARNSLIATGDGGATGTMSFLYQDDDQNYESDERPEFTIEATGDPAGSAPGIIRYEITDPGSEAWIQAGGAFEMYVYGPGSFAAIEWDPARYPAGTHTISLSQGSVQRIYLRASVATRMREVVTIEENASSVIASPIPGLNNQLWEFSPNETERWVSVVGLEHAQPGEVLVLDIISIQVEGVTAGTIGSASRLTITFSA